MGRREKGKAVFSPENEKMLTLKTFEMIKFSQERGIIKKNIDPQVIRTVLLRGYPLLDNPRGYFTGTQSNKAFA